MSGDAYSLIPSAIEGFDHQLNAANPSQKSNPVVKKKRNLPGTPGNQASNQLLVSFVLYSSTLVSNLLVNLFYMYKIDRH